jgi:hypothetical protein
MTTDDAKSFIESMLDLSFTSFVSTKLIKVIYLLSVILSCISGMALIVSGIYRGVGAGILSLIVAPLVVILEITVARVCLEIVMVLFRIAQDVNKIANSK